MTNTESDRDRVERVLRERYGADIVRFRHYPGVGQVAVHFIDGVRRLHDSDGEPVGRDLNHREQAPRDGAG